MGRKFIPVTSRDRLYKLFQVDLKTLRCFKRPKLPALPRFDYSSEDDDQTQSSPFTKCLPEEEESVATQSCWRAHFLLILLSFSFIGMKKGSGTDGGRLEGVFSPGVVLLGADIGQVPLSSILVDGEIDGFEHEGSLFLQFFD